jgi:hypothetical protein
MKYHILVLYYSQTGQLRDIIDRILLEMGTQSVIEFKQIEPEKPFSFPWNAYDFFDCMPESVQMIPEPIHPIRTDREDYDLVILGWQPWFLSPSIPMTSFLKSSHANILKGKRVLTVCGSRNMWLNAHEQIKKQLLQLEAKHCGHLVFFDRNPNLTSVLTVIRWTFKGQKESSSWLPEAGVQKNDIAAASRFGKPILEILQSGQWDFMQNKLLELQGIELKPGLIVLEKRAIKNFRKFSMFILERGHRGDLSRKPRVLLFKRLLLVGVFILSPISQLSAKVQLALNRRKLEEEAEYFKNIRYRENAL